MHDSRKQITKNTIAVLYKAIQSTLTKALLKTNSNTISISPEETKKFDEATNSIIFDKLNQKLNQKG